METDTNCPFCFKKLMVEQEDHESFIILCNTFPCDDFYLNQHVMAGPTPEAALEKLAQFLVELSMGGSLWESKIKAGLGDD